MSLSFKTRIQWPLGWPQPQVFRGYFSTPAIFKATSKLFGSQGCSYDKNWLEFFSIFFKIFKFRSSIKVPMKWNFRLLFYFKILKSMILWFVIFEFGPRTSAYEFFPRASKLANSSQFTDQNMHGWRHKVCNIASERNKRRSVKFVVSGGPVLASCKTPLTRKALSCLRSQKSTFFAISSDTPIQLQSDESVRVVPSISNKVPIDGFKQLRSSAMEMS